MITAWIIKKLGAALWPVVGVAFVLALLWGGAEHWRANINAKETQECKDKAKLDRASATDAALKQSQEYRAEEQRRIAAQKEATDEAERKLSQARADKAIADAAADKLRDRIASYVAAAREAAANPPAVGTSPATDDPIGVLADVLGRADARAGLLADLADKRGAAGSACEQQYDSLEVKATP